MPGRRLLAPTPHQNKDWPTQKKTLASDKHSRCLSPSAVRAQSLQKHSCRCAAIFAWIFDSAHHADQINFSERWQCSDVQQSTYQKAAEQRFFSSPPGQSCSSSKPGRHSRLSAILGPRQYFEIWLRRFNICGSDAQNASQVQKNAKFEKHVFWCIAISQPSPNSLLASRQNFGPCRSHFWGSMEFFFFLKKKRCFCDMSQDWLVSLEPVAPVCLLLSESCERMQTDTASASRVTRIAAEKTSECSHHRTDALVFFLLCLWLFLSSFFIILLTAQNVIVVFPSLSPFYDSVLVFFCVWLYSLRAP